MGNGTMYFCGNITPSGIVIARNTAIARVTTAARTRSLIGFFQNGTGLGVRFDTYSKPKGIVDVDFAMCLYGLFGGNMGFSLINTAFFGLLGNSTSSVLLE